MAHQYVFRRYELKYLITKEQQKEIMERMAAYMTPDEYGHSTICNIYFDTPHHLLIRRSIEKPIYKEKVRLRTYGITTPDSTAFVELKKKFQSVVSKRRVSMKYEEAMAYMTGGDPPADSQIVRELDYAFARYAPLQPAMVLSYERDAFYGKDDRDFRITFDENILWRTEDLSLISGVYGRPLLHRDEVLMEIKTGMGIPLWMTAILSDLKIYKRSFSKYGNAYKIQMGFMEGIEDEQMV